jgi:alpha-beta hydrolase superfamily lysophospholipase
VHDVITLRAAEQSREAAAKYVARIGELAIPVLVVQGGDDPLAPAARARALRAPKLSLEVVDGALHDLLHDRCAGDVAQRVVAWLERALPPG